MPHHPPEPEPVPPSVTRRVLIGAAAGAVTAAAATYASARLQQQPDDELRRGTIAGDMYHDSGELQRIPANEAKSGADKTEFMVMREGRIVFEGAETELESSTDSYISKFVRKR